MTGLERLRAEIIREQERELDALPLREVGARVLADFGRARTRRRLTRLALPLAAATVAALGLVGLSELREGTTGKLSISPEAPVPVATPRPAPATGLPREVPPSESPRSVSSHSAPRPAATTTPPVASAELPRGDAEAWRALAVSGRHREALAALSGPQFERLCAGASADDLLLVAEAARFAGDRARSRQALEALRQRFPDGEPSTLATFQLGRLAAEEGDPLGAARSFEEYLRTQPNGPLAREAAGRLLEARIASGDRAAARRAAGDYLSRYPDGSHAPLARRTLGDAP